MYPGFVPYFLLDFRGTQWTIITITSGLLWNPLEGKMAERTGLEPATPGVTGRYSNQLNYRSKSGNQEWVLRGSNPRHSPCKGDALPAELSTQEAKN